VMKRKMAEADGDDRCQSVLQVCDAHMHCWDQQEKVTKFNNHILGDCGSYLPSDYREDMQLIGGELKLRSCVHVEAFPTDQVEETRWIQSLRSEAFPVAAIVANANISLQKENDKSHSTQAEGMEALEDVLARHKARAPELLKGIRWVLNHEPNWPQTHRGDYFTCPHFRKGFEKVQEHGLRFDLQLNPHQMKDAAAFFKEFPDVPVVLDHIGNPLPTDDVEAWQEGLKALAALPHVFCKLSMLAYTVPDWWLSDDGKATAKTYIRSTIDIFGPERCMFASNFPAEPAGIGRKELWRNFVDMVADLPQDSREALFFGTAERFYGIESTN